MAKKISDEAIITAILNNNSVTAAAAELGITSRSIYVRMKEPSFDRLYNCAKSEVLRQATAEFTNRLSRAAHTMETIMDDETANAQTRLQAAQCIVSYADKFIRHTNEEERTAREKSMTQMEQLTDALFALANE